METGRLADFTWMRSASATELIHMKPELEAWVRSLKEVAPIAQNPDRTLPVSSIRSQIASMPPRPCFRAMKI